MSYKAYPKYIEEKADHGKQEHRFSLKLHPMVFQKTRDLFCFWYHSCNLPSPQETMHVKMLLMSLVKTESTPLVFFTKRKTGERIRQWKKELYARVEVMNATKEDINFSDVRQKESQRSKPRSEKRVQ